VNRKHKLENGLPSEVKFCRACVISNQRPNSTIEFRHAKNEKKDTIAFSVDGICDACKFSEIKESEIDWEQREKALKDLCDQFRKPTGYDVIVPGSGGKDSAYTAHILKYKYGMNPLTATWAPHLYTEIGWQNFTNWMHKGGLDNVLFTPNGKLHRLLTRLAFLNLLHPFQPFIVGQRLIGPKLAARYGVNLVMYGENQAEYGNDSAENQTPTMSSSFFSTSTVNDVILGGVPVSEIISEYGFRINDFDPYLPISFDSHNLQLPTVHYLGYYLKWDPQECYYYASEHTGFLPNPERTEGSYSKYSSIDDKIDPFHYYTTLVKFGIGRASYDAAQEIRNKKITREEGVELVRKYDQEFPSKYFNEFLSYVDLSEQQFHDVVDSFRPPHLWYQRDGRWELRHTVHSN
jgi:N-acetyl sugar amidotransferase